MSATDVAGAAPAHADNRPYVILVDNSVINGLWNYPSAVGVRLPGLFWEKVGQAAMAETDVGCWPWPGSIDQDGYARYGNGGDYGTPYVHLLLWRHEHGEPPEGHEIDHVCRVRHCVNPAHRECVTVAVNRARRVYEYKTECPKGHPYSGDNLYRNPKTGKRYCRECMRAAVRRYRAERQAS